MKGIQRIRCHVQSDDRTKSNLLPILMCRLEMPDRFRGIQHFDPDKCIVCNQCARVCPTECITLTGKANPDPEKKGKVIDTYDINFEICILCDLCTEVCPTEAIVMTNNFELATYSRDDLFKDMEWLS